MTSDENNQDGAGMDVRNEAEEAEGMKCPRCNGEGWLEPIGPCADGSYITSRPCPKCRGDGAIDDQSEWDEFLGAARDAYTAEENARAVINAREPGNVTRLRRPKE
jgi:Zn-finger nucleic acid-binding protein